MKADSKTEATAAPAGASKKKLLIVLIGVLVLVGGGGAAAWTMLHGKGDAAEHKEVKLGPPVFVQIDAFTVNLQPETGDQYLQIAFTLQVAGQEQVELIKTNMPKVRSRLLLLLSGKKASELNTIEGKKQLAKDIIGQVKLPFEDKAPQQEVTDVLFTSFIIQ